MLCRFSSGRVFEVLVEPVGDGLDVFVSTKPAMTGAGLDDEFAGDTGFGEGVDHGLGLFEGDEFVGVAVDDESGGGVGCDEIDGGDLFADCEDFGFVGDDVIGVGFGVELVEVEGGFEPGERAATEADDAGCAVVEEIGGREEAADGLDGR